MPLHRSLRSAWPGGARESDLELLRGRLHDTTLQTLEFIASGGMVGREADLEELMRLAAREATELREYLQGLADGHDEDLQDILERVVAQARCLADHEVEVVAGRTDGSVRGFCSLELGGAVREALTNVRKHARARRATVYLEEKDGAALIKIEDDGVGADLDRVAPRLGMRHSLIERMARLGGSAKFESSPGRGMRVTLRLPSAGSDA